MPIPDPGSRIQGSKRYRTPDPQHRLLVVDGFHDIRVFLIKETKMMDWILQLVKELKSERSAKVIIDGFKYSLEFVQFAIGFSIIVIKLTDPKVLIVWYGIVRPI